MMADHIVKQKNNALRQHISSPLRHSFLVVFSRWNDLIVSRVYYKPEIPFSRNKTIFFYLFFMKKAKMKLSVGRRINFYVFEG